MKKNYVAPFALYVNIEGGNILTTSVDIDKENSGDIQLGNKYQGSWGNIWEQ